MILVLFQFLLSASEFFHKFVDLLLILNISAISFSSDDI